MMLMSCTKAMLYWFELFFRSGVVCGFYVVISYINLFVWSYVFDASLHNDKQSWLFFNKLIMRFILVFIPLFWTVYYYNTKFIFPWRTVYTLISIGGSLSATFVIFAIVNFIYNKVGAKL